MTCDDVERDLDPYVDRELDMEAAAAVRTHLNTCITCRRRVADRHALGQAVRSLPYYAAPDRLRARIGKQSKWPGATRLVTAWAAAAALVVAIGGGILLTRSTAGSDTSIADQVVSGHVRSLMADHLFDVRSTDQHTVKPWFLGKLDFSPPVADLNSIGFPLVGGRLDYVAGQPVAALVYQRRQHTINVFVWPSRGKASATVEARTIRGFHVRSWTQGAMSLWAVSDLNDDELTEFAQGLKSQ